MHAKGRRLTTKAGEGSARRLAFRMRVAVPLAVAHGALAPAAKAVLWPLRQGTGR